MRNFEAAPADSILERWEGRFFTTDHHGIQFLDPVYNEPLEPYAPPRSVLEDPLVGDGLYTLQRLSRDRGATLQLVLGLHGSAEHFRDIAAQHGTVLQRQRFIGIEANWRATKAAQDTPLPQHYRTRVVSAPGRHGFQFEQLRWLQHNNKSALPCELRDDYATDLTGHERAVADI